MNKLWLIAADKRKIKDFLKLPSATSLICKQFYAKKNFA
jgi:hypothetical protein